MRTHLANTALRVDDWILTGKGRNSGTFQGGCSNIQEEEHSGKRGIWLFFCSVHFWRTESRLILVGFYSRPSASTLTSGAEDQGLKISAKELC